jgi:outer membrane protein TolC
VRQALENNRTLKIASLEVEKAGDSIAATRTQRLPRTSLDILGSQLLSQVRFQVDAGQFGTFPGTGPIPAENTFLTTPRRFNAYVVGQVAQPLSQLYKIQLGIQQGMFAREVALQKLRAQQQTIADNVKRVYLAALDTESALEASEETLRFYREMDRLVGNYVVERVALTGESLEVKTKLAQEEYNVLALQNTLATRKEQLDQLLGREIGAEFALSALAEPGLPELDVRLARSRALEQRPEVQEARLRVRQAEQDRRIKKAEYIPDVSLSFNYLSPFGIEFLPKNVASAGMQLSWEPFDWGRKKHELVEKDRSIEQAQESLQDTEQRVVAEVGEKYRKLAEARALVRVAGLARDSSREGVRVAQSRYAERAILLSDALQAQSNAAAADHNYRQAVLAFWTARTEFEKALGEDP